MNLPKLTLALKSKMDAVAKAASDEERLRKEYAFLSEVFEKDELASRIDGEKLETCDVALLETTYFEVVDEYEAPIREAQRRNIEARLESLSAIDFEKISALMESSRQGFRFVK